MPTPSHYINCNKLELYFFRCKGVGRVWPTKNTTATRILKNYFTIAMLIIYFYLLRNHTVIFKGVGLSLFASLPYTYLLLTIPIVPEI